MKFSGSPASTLQRQKNNAGPSSDLGSSVGDEVKSTDFTDTLVSHCSTNQLLKLPDYGMLNCRPFRHMSCHVMSCHVLFTLA